MESNIDNPSQINLNEEMNKINDNLNINNENFNKSQNPEDSSLNLTKNKEISNEFFEEEDQEGENIIYKDSEHKQIRLLSLDLLLKKIVIENLIEDNPLIIYYFCQQCFSFIDKKILFEKIINCYNYYYNKGTQFKQLSSIIKFFNILVIEMLDYYSVIKKDDPILKIINHFLEDIKNDLNKRKSMDKENSKNDENNINIHDNTEKILLSNNNENNFINSTANKNTRNTININEGRENNKIKLNDNKENIKNIVLNNESNEKNHIGEIKENLILNKNIDINSSFNNNMYNTKDILSNNNISNKSFNSINIISDNYDDSQNISCLTNENNISELNLGNINTENSINESEIDEIPKTKTLFNYNNNNLINEINDNEKNLNINNIANQNNKTANDYSKDENDTENNLKINDISNDYNKLTKKKFSNTIKLSKADRPSKVEKSDTITRLSRFSLFFSFRKGTPCKEPKKSNNAEGLKKNKSYINLRRSKKYDMKIKVNKVIPPENEISFYLSIIKTLFTLDKINLKSIIKSSKEQLEFYKDISLKLSEIFNHPIKIQSKRFLKSLTETTITKHKKKATENIGYFNVLDFHEKEIGEKLMIISIDLLNKIERKELYKAVFLKKDKLITSPNVMRNIEQFNKLTFFIIQDIISYYYFKDRAKIIEKWTKIGDYCRNKKDYNDLMAINSALNNYMITGLKTTFKELKSKTKNSIKEMNSFCNYLGNYKNIRDDMKNLGSNEHYIPYLGMLLRDFAFFEENFKYMNGKMINLEKLEKIQLAMEEFFRFKNLKDKINFTSCKELNFFEKLENLKEDEIEKLASKVEQQEHIHKHKINKKLTVIDKKYFSSKNTISLNKELVIDSKARKSTIK